MLRDYQHKAAAEVQAAWGLGARNVMMVMPTGAGKTHTKTQIAQQLNVPSIAIAHRQELVLQISCSLASFGMMHDIIAPTSMIKFCVQRHAKEFGRSFYRKDAQFNVAGVRTLLTRKDDLRQLCSRIKLWDIDEAHHVLPDNQWGQAVDLFPSARGLGVTATPLRCDRQGLDGVFNHMVVGPSMRDLINQGHLSDYKIFCPPVSLDFTRIRVSDNTKEFVQKDLVQETERSQIVGDVVSHYLKFAAGKRGLTFAVDVTSATKIAEAYNAAGVPAAVVTAKTPDAVRVNLLDRLAQGTILQLVNVDLFGEGMDCPAIEVVSMARPTQSYGLYVQQFGRALRTLVGKEWAIIIDHVGNVIRHGLPDAPRDWTLSAPEKRKRNHDEGAIRLTVCNGCFQPYRRVLSVCPYCGHRPTPDSRAAPEFVDGDLEELDPAVLARMRGEMDYIDGPPAVPAGASPGVVNSIKNRWLRRQAAQHELRERMALWAGQLLHGQGYTDTMIQKEFYLTFGIDMISAQSLGTPDAQALMERIKI